MTDKQTIDLFGVLLAVAIIVAIFGGYALYWMGHEDRRHHEWKREAEQRQQDRVEQERQQERERQRRIRLNPFKGIPGGIGL